MMFKEEEIYDWLENVSDPEIHSVSIRDMGILREVKVNSDNFVEVIITPTYSGCPAMDIIAMQIRMALIGHGVDNFKITHQIQPAWTTDWITEKGKENMLAMGIAPPNRKASDGFQDFEDDIIPCPKCGSKETEMISQFGATSCKAMYKCLSCLEPFEHFKCH
ncbi:MAG TPA: 1,2-phenylacetyl-CoA epoxidase subunit PaaD [Edaphocola sp.]|nr:1,2-phenylacetyl-CoA epoxidase subunit PaaD [Edaphocola sp.]